MGAQAQRLSKDQLLERALQCAAESNQEKAVALLRSALALSHEPTCTSHALAAAADAGLREEVLPLAEHAARVLRSPLLQGLVGLLHSRADRLDLAACHYRRSQGLAQRVPECRAVLEQIPAPANEPPPAGSLALVPTPKRERSNDAPRVESASSKELRRLRTENQARVCKVLVLEAELSVARADIQRLTEELVDRQREELAPVVLHRLVREELEAREQEAREKVEEMLGRALGKPPIQADAKLVELLRIAESTFQTSLHAIVPPSRWRCSTAPPSSVRWSWPWCAPSRASWIASTAARSPSAPTCSARTPDRPTASASSRCSTLSSRGVSRRWGRWSASWRTCAPLGWRGSPASWRRGTSTSRVSSLAW